MDYAWVFIRQYDIKAVVAPSRGRIILDIHYLVGKEDMG